MIYPIDIIPFYKVEIDNWQIKKQNISSHIKKENFVKSPTENNLAMFSSDRGNNNYKKEFLEIFEKELLEFCSDIKRSITVDDVWTVSYEKGDYHSVHTHGNCNYSAVLYYNFDPTIHTGTNFVTEIVSPLTQTTKIHYPPADEGMIYFFPANMLHFTTPNMSEVKRECLSFDISF